MNELVIDGKIFISTRRAAELTGYTKDYVGQLARGQKISARLVGRNWYVDEHDILSHVGLIDTDKTEVSGTLEETHESSDTLLESEDVSNTRDVSENHPAESYGNGEDTLNRKNESTLNVSQQYVDTHEHADASPRSNANMEVNDYSTPRYESDEADLFPYTNQEGTSHGGESLEEQVVELRKQIDVRHKGEEYTESDSTSSIQDTGEMVIRERTHPHEYVEKEYTANQYSFSVPYRSLLVLGGATVFILLTIALAVILYPNVISQSANYSRKVDQDLRQTVSNSNQSASSVSSFLEKTLNYTR